MVVETEAPTRTIGPQAGPQRAFLETAADIAVYGGAAGSGKSYGLLLEPLRHTAINPRFGGVIFRREHPRIMQEGGIWDESEMLYPLLGATANKNELQWTFPIGSRVGFGHMQYEADRFKWHGAQIAYIAFDELTEFTELQFWYMLSRNRSTSGIKPYIRATCNPDVDSWVAELIAWWIDQETGYPIPERSGVVRWFVRDGDMMVWANTPRELAREYPEIPPKSFTFIPADIHDNPALLRSDPGYLASLYALPEVERMRLLRGNWKIRAAAGNMFRREWFGPILDMAPVGLRMVRYWDLAASKKKQRQISSGDKKDGTDWVSGFLLGIDDATGLEYILDIARMRGTPNEVEMFVKLTGQMDGKSVAVCMEQEPGSAGVIVVDHYIRDVLRGHEVYAIKTTGDKVSRAKPFSSAVQAGNVKLVRSRSNDYIPDFLKEAEGFPDGPYDDQVDSGAGAHERLTNAPTLQIGRARPRT